MLTVVGEFVGDDCVEGRAVVNKEYPNSGVIIFQVGEGVMKGGSDGVRGGSVMLVGVVQRVYSVRNIALNVGLK